MFGWSLRSLLSRRVFAVDADSLAAERVLAGARVFLGVASLAAVYLDQTEPTRYAAFAYSVLIAYAIYSIGLLVALRVSRSFWPGLPRLVHGVDVLVAATVTLFTEGPTSPFFVYFGFVLIAAAYRWGFVETVATGIFSCALLSIEALLTGVGGDSSFIEGQFELNRFIMRTAHLTLLAMVAGFLAEHDKHQRAQLALLARVSSRVQAERGLVRTLQAVADELFQVFGARRLRLVAHDTSADRCLVWEAEPAAQYEAPEMHARELGAVERDGYFFQVPSDAWCLLRHREQTRLELVSLSADQQTVTRMPFMPPEGPLAAIPFSSIAAGSLVLSDEWRVRLFLIDPKLPVDRPAALRMLRTLMGRVAPAVYNVYLVGRLRSRAGAIERARVARELHDGVIQSLIGIEMRLDVARARATADRSPLEADLVAAQQLLRNEIINVRELMQQLSSIEVRPHQLVELLATMVARFYRETGIHAQFTSALDEVDLTPRACRELVRIVQEALINVRRHSGAQRALVHLAAENGHVRLTVDDDGRGFGFAGRVHHRQLEPEWRGPRVIQERVRSLGGDLTIDSRPGRGARLEIVVPKRHVGSNA